jgi:hypothetical protein
MAQREQANVPLLMTIGAVSGVMVIVMAIGIQAWFLREMQKEVSVKWDATPVQPLTDKRAAEVANISSYRWIDKDKQRVAIPIDDAIKLVVQQQNPAPTTQPK